jgi:putative SOS response-associated peptidase YedK
MCGRFVRYSSLQEIVKEFDIEEPSFDVPPSYNIAPSHSVAIIMNDSHRKIALCKWGFIPSWSKDPATGYKMINARAESVAEKPSFSRAFKSKRVLIAANGFYEWKKEGKTKSPYYIGLKSGMLFGFAGLYNMWKSPEGNDICTCTIITTDANSALEPIHNRMPVIIRKEDESAWLDPENKNKDVLLNLLKPYDSGALMCYEVSQLVNSPSNNSPGCVKPLEH